MTICGNRKLTIEKRIIDPALDLYLHTFSAVLIEGTKWCGKKWTAENHSKSKIMLSDPSGNFGNKQLALMSPDFVLKGETPRLIDEWQVAHPVWDAVRGGYRF